LPLYVLGVRPETREVVVGTDQELTGHEVTLRECNWLAPALRAGDRCDVQLRYRSEAVPATVRAVRDDSVTFDLHLGVRAIAPGQSGAVYGEGDQLLGGGVIASGG
jgi:tRNA-specific 2-thiouridylase